MPDSRDMNAPASIHVMVGILVDAEGRVLLAERPAGKHMSGHWEFPGGKLEHGERPWNGLVRELDEELGILALQGRPMMQLRHRYPDREVLLDTWLVTAFEGEPHGRDGQRLTWVTPAAALDHGLLEADRPIIDALLQMR
jgi:8-oxo-dGTP diphosphatase